MKCVWKFLAEKKDEKYNHEKLRLRGMACGKNMGKACCYS